ncbi:MAG: nitroreductase family protein [Chlamydiae bacterium]|nr:nitroreductase family protein [Chlamydiota bacterium]
MDESIAKHRPTSAKIHPLIHNRWSPRSMTGESLTDEELAALFEAARLSPSCYNAQPWRFIYATNNDPEWNAFLDLLVDFNKSWCKKAGALIVIASRKRFEHNEKPSQTHSFDAGAACMSLALEGASRGLVVHGMGGFDYEKAAILTKLPADFEVNAMFAVGKKASKESLSPELQEKEIPSGRRPLTEIIFRGNYHN